jgi:hypothetical protein
VKYVSDVCRNINIAFPQLEGIEFNKFYIHDNNPKHERIVLTGLIADILADKEMSWRWSRYGVDGTWDFAHIV